ncbi:MAG: ABC transporter ATP-binding protein [Betaproteobacteria bacterium]|jgi:ABC-type branched-subunit amino acid transport system ATPase component|nr:ABC transporter ATP-binding protein [Betaproteobacteria bacterium]
MAESTALDVQGVSKRFGGLLAVDDLSFAVRENEVLGLIGPNGSGKTTVMNLISGLLKPNGGEIFLGDRKISDRPARIIARAGVARTFQLVRILPSLTVLENVIAGAVFGHKRLWGRAVRQFALRQLERVGMGHAVDAPTASLTYIDEKRVELARALASDPRILLLDEWLAGLNPTELQIGIDLISSLREEGRTIILVEHVMDAIRSLCDRCVVMNSGAKIAEGTPEQTLADREVIRAYLGDEHA